MFGEEGKRGEAGARRKRGRGERGRRERGSRCSEQRRSEMLNAGRYIFFK